MLQYIFKAVLITSFAGAVLTLILTLLRPLTKKYFSAGWHYYVWVAVLTVMILPVRISLPQSIVPDEAVKIETPVIGEQTGENVQMPAQVIEETQAPQYIASESFSALKVLADSKMDVMSLIWLAGMIILFLAKIIGYVIFLIRLRKNSCVVLCPELTRFTDKKIITRRSAGISSPLMTGLFRPTLLLPEFSMTEEQLNNVLAHEMMHFKRKDILLKWLTATVKCVHWFNPVIYYVSNQVDTECEISCDMAVVKEMTKEQEMGYVNTILALLAAGNSKTAALTTGMTSNKKRLKRRFTMIKNRSRISKKTIIISTLIGILVLSGTVFASGILNGALLEKSEDEMGQLTDDEPTLKVNSDDIGTIIYNTENGEIISVESEPKLVPSQEEADSNVSTKSENETNSVVTRKEVETQTNVSKDSNNNQPVLVPMDFIRPCEGEISAIYSVREHPLTGVKMEHNGIDIKAPEGTTVVASAGGTVAETGFDSEKGNYIVIEENGVKTLYSQLSSIDVNKGDKVTTGNAIGKVGKTGQATGSHLHFEVMINGEYHDPQTLLD